MTRKKYLHIIKVGFHGDNVGETYTTYIASDDTIPSMNEIIESLKASFPLKASGVPHRMSFYSHVVAHNDSNLLAYNEDA